MLLDEIPLDTREIPQSLLNIESKERSNLLAWKGQFSPQLVDVLLDRYSGPETRVLDPFMGSGTVLHEAALRGIAVAGSDINPAAFILARTYMITNVSREERLCAIRRLDDLLHPLFSASGDLFSSDLALKRPLQELLSDLLLERSEPTATVAETLIMLADAYRDDPDYRRIARVWDKFRDLVLNLPFSEREVSALHCDSRSLPLGGDSADLIITSPPYINVFNYHQQYRQSAESLGWDLLKVAKSEVGSNRKHRGNRFLTAIQYCLDIAQTFSELKRVCTPNARLIFVVGRESTVRGVKLLNGDIVARIAHQCFGLLPALRQERVFRNRFGQNIFEDILHFTGISQSGACAAELGCAREVAITALQHAAKTAPADVVPDLHAAIGACQKVEPSPIFHASDLEQYRFPTTLKKEKDK
jgi:methylase of polypeptide subunit release factors